MMEEISIKESFKLFNNITEIIQEKVANWNKTGLVNIFSQHTTSFVHITEDETLLHADIRFFLDKTFPKQKPDNRRYLHDLISIRKDVPVDERINAFSHMRGLFFSNSVTVPVKNGKLNIGKWQSIFIVELDPIRDRKYIVTFCESK